MADLPEYRLGKIFRKLITARLVIASLQMREGFTCELPHLLFLLLNKLVLIFATEEGYTAYLSILEISFFFLL